MLNVGLLFHGASSDNLGVGALTQAQVEILRAITQATGIQIGITLFDWAATREPYVIGPDISVVTLSSEVMKDPRRIMSLFRDCDVIVDIGAGDSFAETYGKPRLRRMFYLKYLAHLSRVPLVLAPQTIGPFRSVANRLMVRDLVRRATLVATRDDVSTAHLRKIGVTRPVVTASDVALCLKTEGPVPSWDRPVFGLNVSGLLMAGGYEGSNQFALRDGYPAAMRALLAGVLTLPDPPNVVLVPHVISAHNATEDDMTASLRLQEQFPQIRVAPAFRTPGQAKAFISSLDFFAGARMHACIAAMSSEVPVVPIAYSGKFAGLFGALGYTACADCRELTAQEVADTVIQGYAQRAELAKRAQDAHTQGTRRLGDYADALSRVISDVALRKRNLETSDLEISPHWRAMDERL